MPRPPKLSQADMMKFKHSCPYCSSLEICVTARGYSWHSECRTCKRKFGFQDGSGHPIKRKEFNEKHRRMSVRRGRTRQSYSEGEFNMSKKKKKGKKIRKTKKGKRASQEGQQTIRSYAMEILKKDPMIDGEAFLKAIKKKFPNTTRAKPYISHFRRLAVEGGFIKDGSWKEDGGKKTKAKGKKSKGKKGRKIKLSKKAKPGKNKKKLGKQKRLPRAR